MQHAVRLIGFFTRDRGNGGTRPARLAVLVARSSTIRKIFACALFAAAGYAGAANNALTLEAALVERLGALPIGASAVVDAFPDGFGGNARLSFRRIDVYAPGARLIAVTDAGERELPRSTRIELIGADAAGAVRASLAFDPGFTNVVGTGVTAAGAFAISAEGGATGTVLRAVPLDQSLPAGVNPHILEGDDGLPSGQPQPDALAIALASTPTATAARGAVVGVDTDNELMTKRFGNNTTAAANWIADLFAAMNVMYQRDLNVTLQQGTTYLRTTPDPYAETGTPANGAALSEFGSYWQTHYAGVPRSFAMLLSGKSASGNSASGIAWVNAYCRTQSQGGSYSVNQVFTNAAVNIAYSVLIVGHELGHNFGAYHTHCTNTGSGAAPTASNTIDRCYSAESGCYSGATSCPASGPGAPAGTVMSYCNQRACGSGGQNVAQFHPTQVGVLNALIAQNTPACLSPSVDRIFANGFQ